MSMKKIRKTLKNKDKQQQEIINQGEAQYIEAIKKSMLVCQTPFDLQKLTIRISAFLPMTYEEALEEVIFTYQLNGMKSVRDLKSEEKIRQYQFLINFKKLFEIWKSYDFPLTEDNIFYDENYLPYIKFRDLPSSNETKKVSEFLNAYQIFIGGILGQKYTISQLQESGLEILKTEPLFTEFYEVTSHESLVVILRQRKAVYEQRQHTTKQSVSKTSYRFKSILAIVAPILLMVTLGGLIYSNVRTIPHQEQIITANEAYVRRDFVGVIDSLEQVAITDMSINTKYILAVSYARSEHLSHDEISRLVNRLSVQSNERELAYWIYLGRLDVEHAQDLAMALSDNQLLMYAYMRELNLLENDTTLSGGERQSRISALESNIRSLGDRYMIEEINDADGEPDENIEEEQTEPPVENDQDEDVQENDE